MYDPESVPIFFKSTLRNSSVSGDVSAYQFLSNFFPFVSAPELQPKASEPLLVFGHFSFQSSEHLYQWSKYCVIKDFEYAKKLRETATANECKRLSLKGAYQSYLQSKHPFESKASLRRQTDLLFKRRISRGKCKTMMRKALELKFDPEHNPALCMALVETYPRRLCEHDRAKDGSKWGISPTTGKGENLLGNLLMERRLYLIKFYRC